MVPKPPLTKNSQKANMPTSVMTPLTDGESLVIAAASLCRLLLHTSEISTKSQDRPMLEARAGAESGICGVLRGFAEH